VTQQPADERMAVAALVATMLAAVTMAPLVAGGTWLVVVALTAITVMVTGVVVRQFTRWWPLVVAAQALTLLLALTVLFSRQYAVAGIVPTPRSLRALTDLLRAGFDVTAVQAPPVEAHRGVVLMLAGGLGIMAILVDLLAAGLRRPALAGLPLLAAYCLPAALLPDGLPWYYFVIGAAGFLLLLSADAGDRIRSWGRVLTAGAGSGEVRRASTDGLDGLARGGRRVGAVSLLVAVLLPALIPGLGEHLLSTSGNGDGSGLGSSRIKTLNPILNLRQDLTSNDDTPVIEYSTEVPNPEPMRIVTADVYDGRTFAPRQGRVPRDQAVQRGLPDPPGLTSDVETRAVETSVSVRNLDESYLPLPYPATRVDIAGTWLYDATTLNVVGVGTSTRGLSYTVQHLDVRPTAEQLEAAGEPPAALSPYLRLPTDLPESIREAARTVAQTGTDYEQAVRLQRWFRTNGGFLYSVDAPRVGDEGDGSEDAIAAFLRDRRGYCVHFASAMAVMARTLGIPARVAVGYLPGEALRDGRWLIRDRDAHAWPELYFQGVGWVRFEPTPRGGVVTTPDWSTPPIGMLPEDQQATPSSTASASPGPSSSVAARRPDEESGGDTSSTTAGSVLAAVPWRLVGVLALLLFVLVLPLTTSWVLARIRWRRARSPAARAEAAWDELRRGLADLGVRWAASWTPRALQRRLAGDYRLGAREREALARLVADLEAVRYAPPNGDSGRPASALAADVRTVVAGVSATMPTSVRRRARWFPASGLRAISDVPSDLGRRADVMGEAAGRRAASVRAALHDREKSERDREKVATGSRED